MKKLRWAMDGGFWDVDVSTAVTVDGVARPAAEDPIPLGLSRGARLSRPKQIDFFQRFMAMPLVPSFSDSHGLSFHRLLSLPLPPFARDTWFSTLLGRFDVHKFTSTLPPRQNQQQGESNESFLQTVWTHLMNPNFYALNFCSEWLLTPEDTLLLSLEKHGGGDDSNNIPRKKAVLHHKFPNHNLTLEATSPTLFVDGHGNYWDVPFTLGVDFATVATSDSGMSCHFCINHTSGSPRLHDNGRNTSPVPVPVPPSLLPGLCAKCAVSLKKNFDIWRSEAPKTKLVQPYDIFLSNPHISASSIIGTVITASHGDNSVRAQAEDGSFRFQAKGINSAMSADLFASASISAQHGNFQKLFLDLTRFNARIDVPSVSKFIFGASRLAVDLYNSQAPSVGAVQAICPSASLSVQQQICGPFSFRIDCGVNVDMTKKKKEKEWYMNVINDPVFGVEYALQVLGSAKAVAWYSPKQREFMIELRFFET